MNRWMILLFVLSFAALAQTGRPAKGAVPVTPDSVKTAPDSSITGSDSLIKKPDSLKTGFDSLKTAPDSLKAGKQSDSSKTLLGRHGLGGSGTFFIGIVSQFAGLRSTGENAAISGSMLQDPQDKFDDNDISWPISAAYRYRLNAFVKLGSNIAFYRISNSATWRPNVGDTIHTGNYVNAYALNVFQISVTAQFDIDPLVFSADNFQRCYIAVEGEVSPAYFTTERTELHQNIRAMGVGLGGSLYAGVERYLNERVSISGEIGYGVTSFSKFSDNGVVLAGDVRKGGSNDTYSVLVRHLSFRFAAYRWF